MVANNQNTKRSALDRLKDRMAEAAAAGTASYGPLGKRTFRPTVRVASPANDNRVPAPVLVYRVLVVGAVMALLASAIF
jgi:hypothetical protein